MSLRKAFAAALKFIRLHRGLLQQDLSGVISQSHISQLEAAKTSPTLEATQQIAEAIAVHPLSLNALVYATHSSVTPRELLRHVEAELESLGLLDSTIPDELMASDHPVSQKSALTREQVQAMKAKGLRQMDVVHALGLARSTVSRHWK